MAELSKLKKEILRGAVRENVEQLDDRVYLRSRFRRGRTPWVPRLATGAAALVVVFLSVNAISTGGSERPEVLVVTPKAASAISGRQPLAAPRPIASTVFRLDVGKVVLDPGHGGNDPGASARSGLVEKEITLDVARRLKGLLEEARFRVALTRDADRSLVLRDRVAFANAERADLFVSIHVNSIPIRASRGVETYFLGPSDDPRIEEVTRVENQGSGYAMADFRKLLEGVYAGFKEDESRRLARAVQTSLFGGLREANRAIEDRGVKSAPLAVLIGTEMPGILVEVSCVSNEEEARLLAKPDYRQRIAEALFRGLKEYMDSREAAPERVAGNTEKGS